MGAVGNNELPEEVQALRTLVIAQQETLTDRQARIARLEEENRRLLHNVEVFRRIAFGRGSEKRGERKLPTGYSRQGHLFLVELMEAAERSSEQADTHGAIEIVSVPKERKPNSRRKQLPSHLPVVRTTY